MINVNVLKIDTGHIFDNKRSGLTTSKVLLLNIPDQHVLLSNTICGEA